MLSKILLDQYIQKWRSDVDKGVRCYNCYRLFKTEFMFENYLTGFPDAL